MKAAGSWAPTQTHTRIAVARLRAPVVHSSVTIAVAVMALLPCVGKDARARAGAAIPPRSTVLLVVDLTLAAWALVELGVRVRESVHGKGRASGIVGLASWSR